MKCKIKGLLTITTLFSFIYSTNLSIDEIVLKANEEFEKVSDFQAKMTVSLDVPGLRMPKKEYRAYYKRPNKFKATTKGFGVLPNTGLFTSPKDNFDNLNPDYWNIETGNGCEENLCGWGNQELQTYQQDNVYIDEIEGDPGACVSTIICAVRLVVVPNKSSITATIVCAPSPKLEASIEYFPLVPIWLSVTPPIETDLTVYLSRVEIVTVKLPDASFAFINLSPPPTDIEAIEV